MKYFALIFYLILTNTSYSQDWDIPELKPQYDTFNIKKSRTLLITKASLYSATIIGLNSLWYKDYPRSKFHFINDNAEWNKMDKVGHMTTSYYMGVAGIEAYKWAGFKRNKAIWYGGLSGSLFLTAIEILDGYSEQWGASKGDLVANTTGSLICIGQAFLWDEQKIILKYSFRPSPYAKCNSELLGENIPQQALKDYNGQTYWASANIKSICNIENENFPEWISLSVGYGSNGMIHGYHQEGDPERIKQYLLSLDVDLSRIKSKNKFVKSVLNTFGFIKIPMPTLEYRNNKFLFHPIYY